MIVDRTTLADIFNVSVDTVRKWQQAGCPHIPPADTKGSAEQRRVHYDSAQVHNWLLQRALRSW